MFTRIVERQSFTLAAQDLGLPRSTVTEGVKQLEARLGARLLQRTTRHVSPTLDGEAYYQRCLRILAEVEDADAAFSDAKPRGLLKVDVHGTLARHFLLPGLPAFLARYPDIQLHLGEGDRLVDLIREGVDCVLRVGDLRDSAMIGRRIGLLEEITCASPAYLDRHGRPQHPRDLLDHACLRGQFASGAIPAWEFERDGEIVRVDPTGPLLVRLGAAADLAVQGAVDGLGIIHLFEESLRPHFDSGALEPILEPWWQSFTGPFLYYPGRRHLPSPLRAFVDFVKTRRG